MDAKDFFKKKDIDWRDFIWWDDDGDETVEAIGIDEDKIMSLMEDYFQHRLEISLNK